jgi:hypothetical protein
MKHPFSHIIEAIAEGKEVQWFNKSMGSCAAWLDLSSVIIQSGRYIQEELFKHLVEAADHIDWRVKSVPVTGWINVYPCHELSGEIYQSKSEADRCAADSRIACIEVTYTEGQGLDT